jgi:hypothetical protein
MEELIEPQMNRIHTDGERDEIPEIFAIPDIICG